MFRSARVPILRVGCRPTIGWHSAVRMSTATPALSPDLQRIKLDCEEMKDSHKRLARKYFFHQTGLIALGSIGFFDQFYHPASVTLTVGAVALWEWWRPDQKQVHHIRLRDAYGAMLKALDSAGKDFDPRSTLDRFKAVTERDGEFHARYE